jgi:hypothetical protein
MAVKTTSKIYTRMLEAHSRSVIANGYLWSIYLIPAGDDAHGGREEEDAKAQSVDPDISIPRSLLQLIYE